MKSKFEITNCQCGKKHIADIDNIIVENGAINRLPEVINGYGAKKAFILADVNTYKAAGERTVSILCENSVPFSSYVFQNTALEPDELAVGSAVMHFDNSCDILIGVGSGVINDICKILSFRSKIPYIIVATAPSMDGYASATSSMSMDGLKVSLPDKCADAIIGDIDILKNAPEKALISGLGDMLAKYISIAEWRISNIITGEYYCEKIAQMIRDAVKKCVQNADGLLKRDDAAVKAVFEGLVIGGIAMTCAGLSRPASGVEHYFSHIWDMRGLEFGTPVSTHGIQCAIGTLYAARLYNKIKAVKPDREKALRYVSCFDYEAYKKKLKAFLGKGADTMIALEKKEKKYDQKAHLKRLEIIINNWERIVAVINEEIPEPQFIESILDKIHCPKTADEIGIDPAILPMTFAATKDIRDKYVLSRLCWDIGISEFFEETAEW